MNLDTNQKRFLLIAGGVTLLIVAGLFIYSKVTGNSLLGGSVTAQNTVTPAVVDQTQLDQAVAQALQDQQQQQQYGASPAPPLTPTPAPTPPYLRGQPIVLGPVSALPTSGPTPPFDHGQPIVLGPVSALPTPRPSPAPPPAPRPLPAPAPTSTHYVVKSGDTLWAIARRFYGNGSLYPRIYQANRNVISNPNLIYPGEVLTIPR